MSSYHAFNTPVSIVRPFNKKIKLGALHPTRDFNYIKDTVNGFIAIAESDQASGEVINIGSNYEISIGDTVKLIAELINVELVLDTDLQRIRQENSEVERLWAANSKAKTLTGWKPAYGQMDGFKKGLKETIDWFVDPDHLRQYKPGEYNF